MARFSHLVAITALLIALLLAGCAQQQPHPPGKVIAVASFYPIYDFARNVGGDRADVSVLIPSGVDPHDFEPSPGDIRTLSQADLFIYNGAGLEPWVPQLLAGLDSPTLLAVDTSKGVQLVQSPDLDVQGSDPHIWLDPKDAIIQVEDIRDAFIGKDPAGKDYYNANAAAYISKLQSLDAQFRALFPACEKKDILITHATLAYFCKEYGCSQIPIEGVNEEGEPSAADIASIITQAKERNVSVVFFESMINPQSAQVIAREINGTTAAFNSIHGLTAEQQASGADYISMMEGNAQAIKNALVCNHSG